MLHSHHTQQTDGSANGKPAICIGIPPHRSQRHGCRWEHETLLGLCWFARYHVGTRGVDQVSALRQRHREAMAQRFVHCVQ